MEKYAACESQLQGRVRIKDVNFRAFSFYKELKSVMLNGIGQSSGFKTGAGRQGVLLPGPIEQYLATFLMLTTWGGGAAGI